MSSIKRQALFWGGLFLFVVGFILHVSQLFAMSAVLILLPRLAHWLGRRRLHGLTVTRDLPPVLSVGEAGHVQLQVRNEGRVRKLFFTVRQTFPEGLADTAAEFPVAILGPGQQTGLALPVQPTRRGAYVLAGPELRAADPLGLREYRRTVPLRDELVVYPRPLSLPYLWPASEGGPRALRPRRRLRGEGDEFYAVRDYAPGDDPRHINWKTTARRGKLMVVEHERPECLHGVLLLDLEARWQAGEGDQHTLEYAVTLAATLLDQALERGSTVGLIAAGARDWSLPAASDPRQRLDVLEALARVQADGDQPLASVLAEHRALLPPRSTVLVLSPSPKAEDAGVTLRGLGHPVGWLLLDAGSFPGRPAAPDYGPLQGALEGARCRVQVVRGDRPLVANWRRGGDYVRRLS